MFNFDFPVGFYIPEIAFTSITFLTFMSLRLRNKSTRKVSFDDSPDIIHYYTEPKLYIHLKDVIIDTHSAIPKRHPGNIEKMDPIGVSKMAYYKLKNVYAIRLIYESNDEVWWAREHFGNEILPILRTSPKRDGIFISRSPEIDFSIQSKEFIKFGSREFPDWIKITDYLLKKANDT